MITDASWGSEISSSVVVLQLAYRGSNHLSTATSTSGDSNIDTATAPMSSDAVWGASTWLPAAA